MEGDGLGRNAECTGAGERGLGGRGGFGGEKEGGFVASILVTVVLAELVVPTWKGWRGGWGGRGMWWRSRGGGGH